MQFSLKKRIQSIMVKKKNDVDNKMYRENQDLCSASTICTDSSVSLSSSKVENGTSMSRSDTTSITTRSVQFDESRNQFYTNQDYETDLPHDDQQAQRWYSANEYKAFKKQAVRTSHALLAEASNHDNGSLSQYLRIVQSIYKSCCLTSENVMPGDDEFLTPDQLVQFKTLSLRFYLHEGGGGLERILVNELNRDFTGRRQRMLGLVWDWQNDTAEDDGNDDYFFWSTTKAEELRHELEVLSLPSRLFAAEKARALSDFCYC